MSGGFMTNVRLVTCPKCNKVLRELADVPLYRCGGCGTVLRAKNFQTKIEDAKSVMSGSALAHTTDLGHTSDDKESSSPAQNGSHIPATSNIGDQSNHYPDNCSVTDIEGRNISNEHCVDNEVSATDEGNYGQSEIQDSAFDFKRRSKDELHIERARARRLYLSTDVPNESSSPVSWAPNELDRTADSPLSSGSGGGKLSFCRRNNSIVAVNVCPDAVQFQSKEEVQGSPENVTHENATNYESSGVDADELLSKRKRRPIVAAAGTHHHSASTPVKGVNSGLDSFNARASSFSSHVSEEPQSIGARGSSLKEDGSADETSYSDVIQSQTRRKGVHSPKGSPNGYDTVNRTQELEVTAATDPSSELSDIVGKKSKSATTESGHGFDGSISSYEDQDAQIYKQTFRDVNYAENVGRRSFQMNEVSNITTMQQQAREFFNLEKNHKTMQENLCSPMESGEPKRHQIQNQIALGAEMYPSGPPFNTRGYENGGPSSNWLDGAQDSSMYSADKLPYSKKEMIELLKMVYELRDELNRTPTNTENVDRRNLSQFWNGRKMPAQLACREFMDEADLQSKYSRHPLSRSEKGINWPRQQHPSWMPFSGEVTNLRHYDEYSCQHRQPVDQCFSAQLAAPSACSVCSLNAGLQRVHLHSGEQYCNPYSSSASCPRKRLGSDYPSRFRDETYVDQRLMKPYVEASLADSSIATYHVRKDEMKKFHMREKQLWVRRHTRPVAGGAPFVICYQCCSLVQLPADTFLFKRRFHKLKCGSCSKILKFSLEGRTRIVTYVNDYGAPPPSEVKGRSPVNGISKVNSHSHAVQTSCSDHEYGNSFGRSCSRSEGKQVFLSSTAHGGHASDAGGRKTSSRGSDILKGRNKSFSKQFFSKDKRSVESSEIAGPSANRTFDIENHSSESREPKSRNGSPLHRLMGYTSMSKVFRGPSKEASESFRNKSAR